MSLIREVKERADIVKVAELYGMKLNRAYKCVCPFHKEKTASLSISPQKQIWKCFGCGKGGDVISLVSELLNINALEAAKSINNTLGLGLNPNHKNTYFEINKYKEKRKTEEMFKQWENKTFQLLCDYLHLLWKWEEEKAPKNIEEDPNELFVEAMHNKDYVEYLIDEIFINGTNKDKIWFWKHEKKVVRRIESRVRTYRTIRE
ncbi:MAG: CHC2 zinc finger domain-containing protein [Clostridia bacterium]